MANFLVRAPEGFKSLARDNDYILLRRHPDAPALLVYFEKSDRSARRTYLAPKDFQDGLAGGQIKGSNDVPAMPPWLAHLDGLNIDQMDRFILPKNPAGLSPRDIALQRVMFLQPAIEEINEILTSTRPEAILNRIARSCHPKQNEARYRNWFYTYIACNRNLWSLLPAFSNGDWDRNADKHRGKKFGRPSREGPLHGFPCDPAMAKTIVDGFAAHARVGETLTRVYDQTLRKQFGCETRSDAVGHAEYFHPLGKPFPTYWQFRYRCIKHFTLPGMRRALMGEQDFRNEVAPKQGSFAQGLTNLMQESRADAHYSKEFTRSYVSDDSLGRKLCTTTIYCTLSGYACGIGFSPNAEDKWAYKAALFCAAIDKTKFGEIIGYPIKESEWPGAGLPADMISDRGAGAGIREDNMTHGITPSRTPQSNAPVESRNPRKKKVNSEENHRVSNLTPIEMAKREIERTLAQNASSSATDRTSIDMKVRGINTPLGMWNDMNAQLQNDAQVIPFEEAVRRFLKPVKFNVHQGRLMLHKLPYSSSEFRDTSTFQKLRSLEGTEFDGYVLEISVRKAWLEVDGRLVELDVQAPFQTREVLLSLPELEQLGELTASNEYRRKEMSQAVHSHARQRYAERTGKDWDSGTTRAGRAKIPSSKSRSKAGSPA